MKNVEYFTGENSYSPCGYKRDDLKKHLITIKEFDKERTGIVRFYFKWSKVDGPGAALRSECKNESWIEFSFEDEDNLGISMYDCMQSGAAYCVESIRVKRHVTQVKKDYTLLLYGRKNAVVTETMSAYGNSNSLEEEALAYLPLLGVYTMEDIMEAKNNKLCI